MAKTGLSVKKLRQSKFRDNNSVTSYPSDWELQVKYKIKKRYASQLDTGKSPEKAMSRMRELRYSDEMLAILPKDLLKAFSGCGCPISALTLCGSEVVVDLGCGAGIDSFLVSKLLRDGLVISVDFTLPYLNLLKRHANGFPILVLNGDLERVPLASNLADIVISNAAFNLTINKELAYGEAHRILRPGGQIVMYDLVSEEPLPQEVLENPLAHTTSLGGVSNTSDIQSALENAGFIKIQIGDKSPFSFVSKLLIKAQKNQL